MWNQQKNFHYVNGFCMLFFPRSLLDIINTEEVHIFFISFTKLLTGKNK